MLKITGTNMNKEATQVRSFIDRLGKSDKEEWPDDTIDVVEKYMKRVVEDGTFLPEDTDIYIEFSESDFNDSNGRMQKDISAIFTMGLLLGSSLESDIPEGSKEEKEWLKGNFKLPPSDT